MNSSPPSRCANCPINRRRFFATTGLAGLGLGLGLGLGPTRPSHGADTLAPSSPTPTTTSTREPAKTRVRIVYAIHGPVQRGPDWPNIGFDFRPVMDRTERHLRQQCPNFDFVSSSANGPEQARQILEQDAAGASIDAYLVQQMNCWNQVAQTLVASGKPVLYADFQYGGSGGFLVYTAAFLRQQTPNLAFVASSRPDDLADAVRCLEIVKRGGSLPDFVQAVTHLRTNRTATHASQSPHPDDLQCLDPADCAERLKSTRMLVIRDQTSGTEAPIAGIPIQRVPFAELNEAYQRADRDQARVVANQWAADATAVSGVSRATLEDSAAMYLAERALLTRHHALGLGINCLGGFYGGHIRAYPCLGFHQLNNEGLVGGCEADTRSTATMIVGNLLTQGRPGFMSDPVLDTAKRQIIYAHCVAANRPFGPKGRTNPFSILTHSEDRQGASIRSILPTGHLTTTLQFDANRKQILLHQGLAVDNDADDRACRTKLCVDPLGDFEKLFTEWDHWGWHRVTFYGNLEKPILALADILGYQVVREA